MQMFVQEPERKGSLGKIVRGFKVRAKVMWSLFMPWSYGGGSGGKALLVRILGHRYGERSASRPGHFTSGERVQVSIE